MALDDLMKLARELALSADKLAAIGAALRVRREGLSPDPQVAELLEAIAAQACPGELDRLDEAGMAIGHAWIRSMLRQALELLDNPDRPPGWTHDDPVILDAQGRSSRFAVHQIEALAAQRPSLAATLASGGAFLDIGTGAGWIAIEAARRWPGFTSTGIDLWEPALALARRNVAESEVSDRVAIRAQGLERLDEAGRYDLVWLPGPFIPQPVARDAMPRIARALKPGGTLVFATMSLPPAGIDRLLATLQTVRNGGHAWSADEAETLVVEAGFVEAGRFAGGPLVLVAARRPEQI